MPGVCTKVCHPYQQGKSFYFLIKTRKVGPNLRLGRQPIKELIARSLKKTCYTKPVNRSLGEVFLRKSTVNIELPHEFNSHALLARIGGHCR